MMLELVLRAEQQAVRTWVGIAAFATIVTAINGGIEARRAIFITLMALTIFDIVHMARRPLDEVGKVVKRVASSIKRTEQPQSSQPKPRAPRSSTKRSRKGGEGIGGVIGDILEGIIDIFD